LSEKIIVRQNKHFEVGFWAVNPQDPESENYQPVHGLHEITPYGMLLVSAATCTAQVVLSYAQNHAVPLEEVEFHMAYQRDYHEDCDHCEQTNRYDERIEEEIEFFGDLDEGQKDKLFRIAHQCPIVKMVQQGLEIQTHRAKSVKKQL